MNTAACPALTSCIKLTSGAANLILRFGTEQDHDRFIPKMLSGEWQGTMCLTEPNFGSDTGDIITRSYPTDDPRIWKIKGTKMFITAGRPREPGITPFIYYWRGPKVGQPVRPALVCISFRNSGSTKTALWAISTMSPPSVSNIKWGLHAQATAMLNFGDEENCRGIMLGAAPDARGFSPGSRHDVSYDE